MSIESKKFISKLKGMCHKSTSFVFQYFWLLNTTSMKVYTFSHWKILFYCLKVNFFSILRPLKNVVTSCRSLHFTKLRESLQNFDQFTILYNPRELLALTTLTHCWWVLSNRRNNKWKDNLKILYSSLRVAQIHQVVLNLMLIFK